jgi:hypothetical protein
MLTTPRGTTRRRCGRSTRRTRSEAARAKDKTKQTEDGLPVHSFRTLLADLGTLAKNRVRVRGGNGPEFYELTQPTPLQQRALDRLGVAL